MVLQKIDLDKAAQNSTTFFNLKLRKTTFPSLCFQVVLLLLPLLQRQLDQSALTSAPQKQQHRKK